MRAVQVGDTLGRYELVEELGRGGMAVVFRARDPSLGREVAIKVMHAHLWGNPTYATRFAREARAVAALRHPNIVEIYDFVAGAAAKPRAASLKVETADVEAPADEGTPGYLVSELVRGPTLHEFLNANGHPLPEVAAMVVLKLTEALQHAHQRGIIHRDLKPENVMIAEGGRVVLTDFGIARIAEGEAVTQTGALLGSPAYMSPEQARGTRIDPRSDLFSLGTVLYQLTTGALPFPGKDPISTVLRILEGKYDSPLRRNPQLGSSLERVIRKLLQVDPDNRYADAAAVSEALRQVLSDGGISEPDVELQRYFSAPGQYNKELVTRVIDTSLQLASVATSLHDYPRALAFCDRVLAFEPDHPTALELMSRLSARGRSWRSWLVVAGALVLIGAGGGTIYLLPRWRAEHVEQPARPPDAQARVLLVRRAPDARVDAPPLDARVDSAIDSGRPRKTRHPRRPRDAAAARPDARSLARHKPDARPRVARRTELLVTVSPWCDVLVDGRPVGRSPMPQPVSVTPGRHIVVCRQGEGGAVLYHQPVVVKEGQRREITPVMVQAKVRVQLSRGDAIRLQGQTYRNGAVLRIAPARCRVDQLKGGAVIAGDYVTIVAAGCTLYDTPELSCR